MFRSKELPFFKPPITAHLKIQPWKRLARGGAQDRTGRSMKPPPSYISYLSSDKHPPSCPRIKNSTLTGRTARYRRRYTIPQLTCIGQLSYTASQRPTVSLQARKLARCQPRQIHLPGKRTACRVPTRQGPTPLPRTALYLPSPPTRNGRRATGASRARRTEAAPKT